MCHDVKITRQTFLGYISRIEEEKKKSYKWVSEEGKRIIDKINFRCVYVCNFLSCITLFINVVKPQQFILSKQEKLFAYYI